MIKLFWNTQNQKKPNSLNKKIIKKKNRNYNGENIIKKVQINGFLKFLKK